MDGSTFLLKTDFKFRVSLYTLVSRKWTGIFFVSSWSMHIIFVWIFSSCGFLSFFNSINNFRLLQYLCLILLFTLPQDPNVYSRKFCGFYCWKRWLCKIYQGGCKSCLSCMWLWCLPGTLQLLLKTVASAVAMLFAILFGFLFFVIRISHRWQICMVTYLKVDI